MRITDSDGKPFASVYLALSERQAQELRDGLTDLLATFEAGRHAHVSSSDFSREVTVCREDDAILK